MATEMKDRLYAEAIERYKLAADTTGQQAESDFAAFLVMMGHSCVTLDKKNGVRWCAIRRGVCEQSIDSAPSTVFRPFTYPIPVSHSTIKSFSMPTKNKNHMKIKNVAPAKPKVAKRSASGEKKKKTVKRTAPKKQAKAKKEKKHASTKKVKKEKKKSTKGKK
jgi:hypothetical protein